jgi:hypothetical protein
MTMNVCCTKVCFTFSYTSTRRACGSNTLWIQIIINMYKMFIFSIVDISQLSSSEIKNLEVIYNEARWCYSIAIIMLFPALESVKK